VAERVAQMHAASAGTRAARNQARTAWLERLAGMGMDELRATTPTRLWTVAMLRLGGYSVEGIARTLGYGATAGAARALKHPAVVRLIELVRQAQVERVLRGEYGVAAAAKAAAPAVMEHLAELAGGAKDRATGERRGRAKRDSDAIRAGEVVLTVSGDKTERTAHLHVHVLEEFSDHELEALAREGTWPERYRGAAALLPGPERKDES
jgi:hypothetical protein